MLESLALYSFHHNPVGRRHPVPSRTVCARVPDSLPGTIRLRLEKAPRLGLHPSQQDPDVQITVEFLRLGIGQRARAGFGGEFFDASLIARGQFHRKQVPSHVWREFAFLRLEDAPEDRGFCIGRAHFSESLLIINCKRPIQTRTPRLLQPELSGGVIAEQASPTDVLPERIERAVPGLPHDVKLPRAVQIRLSAEACPQAVPGVDLGIETGGLRGPLHDSPNRILVQTAGVDVAMPVDVAEQRSACDLRGSYPVPPGAHRAGLRRRAVRNRSFPSLALRIGLRAQDPDEQAFLGLLDMFHLDRRQLRPPESAGEADQQQGAIANADQAPGQGIDDSSQIAGEQGLLALLGGAVDAADTLERLAHAEVLHECGGGQSGRPVDFVDGGEPPGERGGAVRGSDLAQVESHGVGRGGKSRESLLAAPLFEVAPVGAVGAQGGIGLGGEDIVAGLAGEAVQLGRIGGNAGGRGRGSPGNGVFHDSGYLQTSSTENIFLSDVRTMPILRICAITKMNTPLAFFKETTPTGELRPDDWAARRTGLRFEKVRRLAPTSDPTALFPNPERRPGRLSP